MYKGFGGREATVGGHHAQPTQWIKHFYDCPNHWVRRSAFFTYWLSRYALNELPSHSIKSYLFKLAIKLTQGISYPLGALCLGNLYTHLDILHEDEVEGFPYYVIETSVHLPLLQVFIWEHSRKFAGKARSAKDIRDRILDSQGDGLGFLSKFSTGFPILFK